jgi:nucleoside 2-deoxyribosyltransferase
MLQIYIASPYSIGNSLDNVERQIDAAENLLNAGICPVIPLFSHYHHVKYPHDYETWMRVDFEKIRRADAVLRLPGKSRGADREIVFAISLNKPVFYRIKDVLNFQRGVFVWEIDQ